MLTWTEDLCRIILKYKVGMNDMGIEYLLTKEPFNTHSLELLIFCHEFDPSLGRLLLIEQHKAILGKEEPIQTL